MLNAVRSFKKSWNMCKIFSLVELQFLSLNNFNKITLLTISVTSKCNFCSTPSASPVNSAFPILLSISNESKWATFSY